MEITFTIPDKFIESLREIMPRFYGIFTARPDLTAQSSPLTEEQLELVRQEIIKFFDQVSIGNRYYIESLLDYVLNGD
jgi:hypothetical protein